MVDMDGLLVLATDSEPVRRYLRRVGIHEPDITQYIEAARQGRSVTVSLGCDDEGELPSLRLSCADGAFELTSPSEPGDRAAGGRDSS
jgi:hypothetical protein